MCGDDFTGPSMTLARAVTHDDPGPKASKHVLAILYLPVTICTILDDFLSILDRNSEIALFYFKVGVFGEWSEPLRPNHGQSQPLTVAK